LSTLEHPIHSATYGESMFRYDLRMLMAENPGIERLQEFAWIMFDVNGLRSFKDCTSHPATTQLLKDIVHIFVDPNGPTRKRLEALGIRVIPMATGGDEFELYLRGKVPITQELIDETIVLFQEEISSNSSLRARLNFDDPTVLMQYGWPTADQRQELNVLPADEQQRRRAVVRADLPAEFIPSVSGGGRNLVDGILHAVDKDPKDLRSEKKFISLRGKVVQGTTDLAKDVQNANKERDKVILKKTNPLLARFQARGQENREQEKRIQVQDEIIASLQLELHAAREQIAALLRPNGDGNDGHARCPTVAS
jgi:GGDEF domain-containing protein